MSPDHSCTMEPHNGVQIECPGQSWVSEKPLGVSMFGNSILSPLYIDWLIPFSTIRSSYSWIVYSRFSKVEKCLFPKIWR